MKPGSSLRPGRVAPANARSISAARPRSAPTPILRAIHPRHARSTAVPYEGGQYFEFPSMSMSRRPSPIQKSPKPPMRSISSCVCVKRWPSRRWCIVTLSIRVPLSVLRTGQSGETSAYRNNNEVIARIATEVCVNWNASSTPNIQSVPGFAFLNHTYGRRTSASRGSD